ncbi:MAG: tRNA 2-thiouridine(34) synthase MnmA [Candidatus Kerfeldbacteria bacterium]|nr:tRNA 2-thiouridine(34) synthase MnmA [Candidatus Kerfeldbacteria bacterium]
MTKIQVAVALSGGVDSAVAAALLQQQGYAVTGFYMKNWSDEADAHYRGTVQPCPWQNDLADVAAICAQLGIDWQSINFEKDYRTKVFQYFLEEIQAGRTPNPDIMCNTQIKFLSFLDKMLNLGYDKIATGHYARITTVPATAVATRHNLMLQRGRDSNKDQSYFIYHLNQAQLKHIIFPIGGMLKAQVRQLASNFHLPVANKPDSQGLCFIGDINFKAFVGQYLQAEPGPMQLVDGTIVGQHSGLPYYTIGQRHGIALGGTGPYYVVDKRINNNTLIIAPGSNNPALLSNWFTFSSGHWISGQRPADTFNCTVKIRYRSADINCTVRGERVELHQPARAVTPGQFAVFYDGAQVLGGGVIVDRELLV